MTIDPDRDGARLGLANTTSFTNVMAAGGLAVLLLWPLIWTWRLVRRSVGHRS